MTLAKSNANNSNSKKNIDFWDEWEFTELVSSQTSHKFLNDSE